MNLDLLARLMRNSRYLPRGQDAALAAQAAVPALADGLPDIRGGDGTFSIACTGMLSGPVERGLRGAIDESLAEMRPDEDQARRLSVDPLVLSLRRVLAEGGSVSPAAATLAALEYMRLCAASLASPGTLLADGVKQLHALPTAKRGKALAGVSAGMRSRLAIAVMEQARAGQAFPAMIPTLTAAPLPYLFTRSNLPNPLDLPILHAAMGGPAPAEHVEAATTAMRLVVSGVLARLATKRPNGDDLVINLRFCGPQLLELGTEAAVEAILTDPEVWASVLPVLARYADAKQLASSGIPAETAKQLLRPEVAIATAAAMRNTLSAVRAWDVLTCLTGALQTVTADDAIARRLSVPRGQAVEGTLVVVGLAGLRAQGNDPAAIPNASSEVWETWSSSATGALRADLGSHGIVVFPDAKSAIRFATSMRTRATGGVAAPPISVATGRILGGTDGATTRIAGPAMREALRLLPPAALTERPDGIFSAAHVAVVGGQLAGSGVVIDTATMELLRRAGLQPGTEKRRPRQIGIRECFEFDGELLILLDVPGLSGGYEALTIAPADWEAVMAATSAASNVRSPPSVPPPERGRSRKKSREEAEARAKNEPIALAADAESEETLSAGFDFAESDAAEAEPSESDSAEAVFVESSAEDDLPRFGATAPEPAAARPQPRAPEPEPTPFAMTNDDPFGDGFSSAGSHESTAFADPFAAGGGEAGGFAFAEPDAFGSGSPGAASQNDDPFAGAAFLPDSAESDWAEPDSGGSETPRPETPILRPALTLAPPAPVAQPADDNPFGDIFGVPVGNESPHPAGSPPTTAAPMMSEFSLQVDDEDEEDPPTPPSVSRMPAPPRSDGRTIQEEEAGFALPVVEGGESVRPPDAPAASPPPPPVDFGFLLNGYACYVEHERVVFGRPYGTRLIDHHTYDTGSNLDRAYQAFLEDKIREGFIPQTEMVGELPRGVTVMPLDPERLAAAWRALT